MSSGPPSVVLHQFLASHFNEKARWALDWKGVVHHRRTYLPGPHAPGLLRLSRQTSTPVLQIDGEVVAGSARIVDALERRVPERPLYPADPSARRQALEIQAQFDAEVGPAARTAVFSVLLKEPDYICLLFSRSKPKLAQALYRGLFPATKRLMARANGVTGAREVDRAFQRSGRALDFVAETAGSAGPLVGDSFSVADLTCASLLAVLVDPPHPDMALPRPMPARLEDFRARWAEHEGARWVLGQYERFRPPRALDAASAGA